MLVMRAPKGLRKPEADIERLARRMGCLGVLAVITLLATAAWITRPAAHFWDVIYATRQAARQCQLQKDLNPGRRLRDIPACLPLR